jgi:hypothetical protein
MQTITVTLPPVAGKAKNQTCAGDFVKIEAATATSITVKTDNGETQDIPVGDGCRFDVPYKNLELSSVVAGDVVEFTYGRGLKIPATRTTAVVPPFTPIDPVWIINSGYASQIAGNIDMSIRAGQPNLNDTAINIGFPGYPTWLFYGFGSAYGSFNGIWFEVTQVPAGGIGLQMVPSHDLSDQSANPNFNSIGETAYLKTPSGFVPINLNDGSYVPAVGDVFYLPFSGRLSLYYRAASAFWGNGFNFAYHFNYGSEPCKHAPATQKLLEQATFNSIAAQTITLEKPIGAKGFYLYAYGATDPASALVCQIFSIDPVSGLPSANYENLWLGGNLTALTAWVFVWAEVIATEGPIANNGTNGPLSRKLLFSFNDPNATALTPDTPVSVNLEWIY